MYDIIGDIHGYAYTLKQLLQKLGYRYTNGYYQHPVRKAIFTGDFIDRGPYIKETLEIVRPMIDFGAAYGILGNHEYNAICYYVKDKNGNYLREHTARNKKQLRQTYFAFSKNFDEFIDYLKWFRELPLFFENDKIRVVHACWDPELIKYIKRRLPDHRLNWEFLIESAKKPTLAHLAIETLLKGKEIIMDEKYAYSDIYGLKRTNLRIQWWRKLEYETYQSIAVNSEPGIPEIKVSEYDVANHIPYPEKSIPVFFGHYWKNGVPQILSSNVCCVDYSIARNDKLVAYRWNGEKILDNNNFVYVNCIESENGFNAD